MDAIANKHFIAAIDGQISDTVEHLYTYLHTLESLLNIKKKFKLADHRYLEYIKKITELHYMLKTGKSAKQTKQPSSEPSSEPASDADDEMLNIGTQDMLARAMPIRAAPTSAMPSSMVDMLDAADVAMDQHIETRRKDLAQTTACQPVPNHPIKWLTDQVPDVAPRVERIEINMDDFEVVEESAANSADIIAALEARRCTVPAAPVSATQPAPASEKTLSAKTAEALGVKFCTPDDEPATVNALFKIGPRHREILYTKLYNKAKAAIALLNPEESKVNELVRLETDRLLAEWIAAH